MGLLASLICSGLCSASCERAQPAGKAARLEAFVSIPPLAYFAERIGGVRLSVTPLVERGQDPHMFEPTQKQMAALAGADLFFRVGMPFEERLLTKMRADLAARVVDLREGVEFLPEPSHADEPAEADDADHDHDEAHHHPEHADEEHDHAHGELDPHIWLSPKLAADMCRTMAQAMIEADPAGAESYRANLNALLADLDALDHELAETLAPLKGRTFYVFHPAFGYFARAYGLNQVAVEMEGKQPSAKQIERVIAQARADGVRVIFVQPQFSPKAAETIARQIGGAVVPIDPLARDYVGNLRRVGQAIAEALNGRQEAAQADRPLPPGEVLNRSSV